MRNFSRHRFLPGIAAIFLLALSPSGFAQVPGQITPGEVRENLSSCLNGLPSCNLALLSPADLQRVSAFVKQRNHERCMALAANCDMTLLTVDQVPIVIQARNQRNLDRCLTGGFQCDPLILTEQQRSDLYAELASAAEAGTTLTRPGIFDTRSF